MSQKMGGWWRRNVWGLLALPVLLVGLGLPYVTDLYGRYHRNIPSVPVEAALGQPVDYAGGTIHLVSLTPVTATRRADGEPLALPPGFAVLRAELAFTFPTDTHCDFTLEDEQGRRFSAGPDELQDTKLTPATCGTADDGESKSGGPVYFLLPPGAKPVAIRVVIGSELPRYVRLFTS